MKLHATETLKQKCPSYLATARLNIVLAITEHIYKINPKHCLQRTSPEKLNLVLIKNIKLSSHKI